jgi:hypothetical protein
MAQDASGPNRPNPPNRVPKYTYLPSPRPKTHDKCCECPACLGLQCLERPRYFAGQLLTEAELNSEQAYVIAKNRLHNRYLHGWGVVCGLEVICHDCAGWVTVHAGYALDPCGNDVIVCRNTEFNVLDAIQKCIDAKRRRDDDCPPWRDYNDNCPDDNEHWCITLQYIENEGRSVMPLQEPKSHCGCGGKCGGGCECGGKKKNGNGNGHGSCGCGGQTKGATPKKASCEPTRIFEQYRIGVIPEPAECATRRMQKSELAAADFGDRSWVTQEKGTGIIALIPREIRTHPLFAALVLAAPDDSIFMRAIGIAQELEGFLRARFTKVEMGELAAAMLRCIDQKQRSNDARQRTEADMRSIGTAWEAFATDHNSFTDAGSTLEAVEKSLSPIYIKLFPKTDGWGQPFRVLSSNNGYRIISGGPDQKVELSSIAMSAPPGGDDIVFESGQMTGAASTSTGQAGGGRHTSYQLCCKFRRAIRDLYAQNPFNVRCAPFDCPPCVEDQAPPQPPTTTTNPVTGGVTTNPPPPPQPDPMCCLVQAFINYVVDAFCMLLLPTCPKPPCEDRVIIACVTVKKGKILHICNHACRHYAGSFNTVEYWMSAVPVLPLIGQILRDVCCSEDGLEILLGLAGGSGRSKDDKDEG